MGASRPHQPCGPRSDSSAAARGTAHAGCELSPTGGTAHAGCSCHPPGQGAARGLGQAELRQSGRDAAPMGSWRSRGCVKQVGVSSGLSRGPASWEGEGKRCVSGAGARIKPHTGGRGRAGPPCCDSTPEPAGRGTFALLVFRAELLRPDRREQGSSVGERAASPTGSARSPRLSCVPGETPAVRPLHLRLTPAADSAGWYILRRHGSV